MTKIKANKTVNKLWWHFIFVVCASYVSLARADVVPSATTPTIAPAASLLHCPFIWPEVPISAAKDELLLAAPYQKSNPHLLQPDSGSKEPFNPLDPFQSLIASPDHAYKGVFVYAPSGAFVFRALGTEGTMDGKRADLGVYRTRTSEISNPKFSPNGKYISYDVGFKDLYSKFDIVVWDVFGKKIMEVADDQLSSCSHWDYRWSPDGDKIAYLSGGEFNHHQPDEELSLNVFDVAHNKSKFVSVNVWQPFPYFGLKHFSWFGNDEILYSKLDSTQTTPYPSIIGPMDFAHSAIYKLNIETRKSTKLIEGALAPQPSPDGKWIAFLGWPNPKAASVSQSLPPAVALPPQKPIKTAPKRKPIPSKKRSSQAKPVAHFKPILKPKPAKPEVVPQPLPLSLYLFNTATKSITRLDDVKIGILDETWLRDISLAWTPDSRSLIVALFFEETHTPPTGTTQTQWAKIQAVDMPMEAAQTPVARLLQDMKFEEFPSHWWQPFVIHSILKDNRTAFIVKKRLAANKEGRIDDEVDLLLALDLQTGAISNVAKFSFDINYSNGWDWAECAP